MKARWLVLAYPLVEIMAAFAVAQRIGWSWTIVLLLLGIPLGWMLTKRAGRQALVTATHVLRLGDMPAMRDLGALPAGLLIMVPGFVTDILGSMLLIPQVRKLLWGNRIPAPTGDVITGQIITRHDERTD
jgi:UPF0716 protein FxsA